MEREGKCAIIDGGRCLVAYSMCSENKSRKLSVSEDKCVPTAMSYSKYYYEELDSQAQERYKDKCTMAGLSTDPYLSKDFVSGGSNQ